MDHLLCCPALVEEHVYLKQIAKSSFSLIPYSTLPFISRGHGLRRIWTSAARENLALEDIFFLPLGDPHKRICKG